MEIGEIIMERRKKLRLSRREVAEETGLAENTIYNIEFGLTGCSMDSCLLLCEALGLTIIIEEKKG